MDLYTIPPCRVVPKNLDGQTDHGEVIWFPEVVLGCAENYSSQVRIRTQRFCA